ncbi:hypothetical protein P3342_007072 [Pyrenophora teres f. teres]|nr:hypothetical protein P3342_007072 [Pyrenophora teres f. teres]
MSHDLLAIFALPALLWKQICDKLVYKQSVADHAASSVAADRDGVDGALNLSSSLSTALECSFLPGNAGSLQITAFLDVGNEVRVMTSMLSSVIWLLAQSHAANRRHNGGSTAALGTTKDGQVSHHRQQSVPSKTKSGSQ